VKFIFGIITTNKIYSQAKYLEESMNKRISMILIVTSWLLVFVVNATWASVLVEPGRFILNCKPGAKNTGTIKVTNQSKKEADVKAVIYDWTLDKNDKIVNSELGTRPETLKGMIKFNPQRFKLAPGASQVVRYTLVVPNETSAGERRGIIFFEETQEPLDVSGAKVTTQVGCTIYLGVTPIKMSFKMLSAKVEMAKNNQPLGVIHLKNEGMGHIRYLINYRLINEKGAVVLEGKNDELVVLPESERKTTFPIVGNISAGKYQLQITVSFQGTNKNLVYNLPFTQVRSVISP